MIDRSWLNYLSPFSEVKPFGGGADVIVAQSFGRNAFPDEGLRQRIVTIRELYSRDEEMFRVFKGMGFDPGKPNISLAWECSNLSQKFGIKKFVIQWEVAFAIWSINRQFYYFMKTRNSLLIIWPDSPYLSSKDMIDEAVDWISDNDLKRVAFVCHRGMAPRIELMLRKALGKEREVVCLDGQPTDMFDSGSVQKWTTNRARWFIREFFVRIHHLFKGWV
ncbi:MAG: hypothetical protein PHG66_06015 [Candidatus Colwellbacteria bacterium]|nr:hypothetical protein [Candidatus Colwellbacteria bacterium]